MKPSLGRAALALLLWPFLAALPAVADGAAGLAAYDRGDFATALKEFTPLAEEGVPTAQAALGAMYMDGLGVPRNIPEALRWLGMAAEQGMAAAQLRLGTLYLLGDGVPADMAMASQWFKAAADKGMAKAQVNMAAMYYQGVGVARDLRSSYLYAALAAMQGDAEAIGMVSILQEEMSPEDVAAARAMVEAWVPTRP
jgi:TPR repeat protein